MFHGMKTGWGMYGNTLLKCWLKSNRKQVTRIHQDLVNSLIMSINNLEYGYYESTGANFQCFIPIYNLIATLASWFWTWFRLDSWELFNDKWLKLSYLKITFKLQDFDIFVDQYKFDFIKTLLVMNRMSFLLIILLKSINKILLL